MRLATFSVNGRVSYGAVTGAGIVDLGRRLAGKYSTLVDLLRAGALVINVSLKEKMPFDPLTDFVPISGLASTPFLLAAPLSFAPSSVTEVIALAKEKPGSLSIAHGGNGTAMHLTAQLFSQMAGVQLTLVPYRGSGPVTQDVLAGHVPLGVTDIPSAIALIENRRIKVLGVATARRVSALPEVPTVAEAGLPGFESIGWFGFVAPAGTPPEVIGKLNEAIVAALSGADVQEQIRKIGAEPMPMSPAEFSGFIRSEIAKWAKVVAQSGAKSQ